MKIAIYPVSEYELAAVSIEDAVVVASHTYDTEETDRQDAVLVLRDLCQHTIPGGPHSIVWVPSPEQHPEVTAVLGKIRRREYEESRDDQPKIDPGKSWCASCAHRRVCSAAEAVEAIEAKIIDCPEHVALPEGEP